MNQSNIAKFFMIGTLLLWGVLDVYLYLEFGNAATESATTWRYGYLFPGLTFFVGSLMGHFFGQWRAPSPTSVPDPAWRDRGEYVVLAIMAIWLGFDVWGIVMNSAPWAVDTFIWKITNHQVWLVFLVGFVMGSIFFPMTSPTTFQSLFRRDKWR